MSPPLQQHQLAHLDLFEQQLRQLSHLLQPAALKRVETRREQEAQRIRICLIMQRLILRHQDALRVVNLAAGAHGHAPVNESTAAYIAPWCGQQRQRLLTEGYGAVCLACDSKCLLTTQHGDQPAQRRWILQVARICRALADFVQPRLDLPEQLPHGGELPGEL